MATQGERRRQAIAAVRQLRRAYRTADSAGEKLERELDRLIKRKTLISPDSLDTANDLMNGYAAAVQNTVNVMVGVFTIILNIPR